MLSKRYGFLGFCYSFTQERRSLPIIANYHLTAVSKLPDGLLSHETPNHKRIANFGLVF